MEVRIETVNKVLDAAKARIKAHETEALTEGNHDRAHAYQMALVELAFLSSEVILENHKTEKNA